MSVAEIFPAEEYSATTHASLEESAPENGALFYMDYIRARKTRERQDSAKNPIVRGLHEKSVPVLESGLVDLDKLGRYLHPNPLAVPLYKTPGWKYHHLNHAESSFKQWGVPVDDRDPRLVALRNSSYQQVHMRIGSEAVYHNVHELNVPHPVSESIDAILRDFERIDMLGAACLYLNLARGHTQYRVDTGSFSPPWVEEIALKERVSFLTEVREDLAGTLVEAEVVPQRLVTSAMKRVSMHLNNDPYLAGLADRRLATDPVFYPVRVPAHKTLLIKANNLISTELLSSTSCREALQTGVTELELVA